MQIFSNAGQDEAGKIRDEAARLLGPGLKVPCKLQSFLPETLPSLFETMCLENPLETDAYQELIKLSFFFSQSSRVSRVQL